MSKIHINSNINYFAKTVFKGELTDFGIKDSDRFQHMYILGQSGTGKSTVMHNIALQDIIKGKSVCLIDPHGDLAETLLSHFPQDRADDLIYFDASSFDNRYSINPFDEKIDVHLQLSGIMSVFTKIWANSWSSRMEYILNNTILTLLLTGRHKLKDIHSILTDSVFREIVIAELKDDILLRFWRNEFYTWSDKYRQEAVSPILNKIGQLLSSPMLRHVFDNSKLPTLNINDVMRHKKVLIINLSKGKLGEDNARLLGTFLLNQIYISTMQRASVVESEREDFHVFVDEFQDFATHSFAHMLSEARKFGVSLTLANQFLDQLKDKEDDFIKKAVFGNVASIISFRLGAHDAKLLSEEFGEPFVPEDFSKLSNYEIYLKLLIDVESSKPFFAKTLGMLSGDSLDYEEYDFFKKKNFDKFIKILLPGDFKEREILI